MDSIAEMIRDWVQQYGPHVNGMTFKPGKVGSIGKARLLKIADMAERLERRECPTDMGGVTDELRHYIEGAEQLYGRKCPRHTAIADRIDAAHDEALQREHESAYNAGYDDGFASADDWMGQHEDAMAEHGWVRLPKDGEAPCKQLSEWIEKRGLITGPLDHDGELWHKGDMSASPWGEIGGIVFDGQCWQVCGHDTSAPWLPADSLLHYHAPTVEDVLREFGDEYCVSLGTAEEAELLAKYAKRLQMAGDGREQ